MLRHPEKRRYNQIGAVGATARLFIAFFAIGAAALVFSGGCLSMSMRPNARDFERPVEVSVVATG